MNQILENRYRIIKELGDGGFGQTFIAEDTHMPSNRFCVIKQLKPMNEGSQIYKIIQDRFLREAAILEKLGNGSNQIPTLYAHFESNGQFYLIQEYIEGKTLSKKLHTQGHLSSDVVKDILVKILPVLDYVHNQGIVHRDIKPDNIIIRDADNLPVLIDFGAVKETMQTIVAQSGSPLKSSLITEKSSIVIGTPGFMSSEQLSGRPVFSSDLYALGMTAIYLLTGKMPQELNSDPRTGEIIWKEYAPNVSPELAAVLDKAIQSHFRDRFSSANEMLNALQNKVVATTVVAPPLPVTSPTNDNHSTGDSNRENKTGSANGQKTAVIISLVSVLLLGGVGSFTYLMINQQAEVQNKLDILEQERKEAAEIQRQEDLEKTKKEQELQRQEDLEKTKREEELERQLEEEKKRRQAAENRSSQNTVIREPEPSSNSNLFPEGTFTNSEWSLTLFQRNNNIYYQAQSLKDPSSLNLQNGRTSGNSERKIYTWNNGTYRYQVIWQPNDANNIRLRVFTPTKGELLNQILSRS